VYPVLNEDPWVRSRTFRTLMPNSRLQMLLRGRNLLGFRHYGTRRISASSVECVRHGSVPTYSHWMTYRPRLALLHLTVV